MKTMFGWFIILTVIFTVIAISLTSVNISTNSTFLGLGEKKVTATMSSKSDGLSTDGLLALWSCIFIAIALCIAKTTYSRIGEKRKHVDKPEIVSKQSEKIQAPQEVTVST